MPPGQAQPLHTTRPPRPGRFRLGTSVQLPWLVGLGLSLLAAVAAATLIGGPRSSNGVDSSVFAAQELATAATAQSVRRSANEAAEDLEVAAALMQAAPNFPAAAVLRSLADTGDRWLSLVLVDPDTRVVVTQIGRAGAVSGLSDRIPTETTLLDFPAGDQRRILAATPVVRRGQPTLTLLGEIDPAALAASLVDARPGGAWILDSGSEVVAGSDASQVSLPTGLSSRQVDAAVSSSSTGSVLLSEVAGSAQVFSYASVTGEGPATDLGWHVLVYRGVTDFAATGGDYRARGLVFGLALAIVSIVVFWWLRRVLVTPLLQLEEEARRIAYGDLSQPVRSRRLDEVGRITGSLERIRIRLVRDDSDDPRAGEGR